MKIKRYKGKAFSSGKYVEGFYYQQPSYTASPMDGDKEEIPIEYYIISAVAGDWNLPYSVHLTLVEPSTITELDEVEINER